MSDDKDLEIARLRGQVEALKEQLDKERALRPVQPAVWTGPVVMPQIAQTIAPCLHLERRTTSGGDVCARCGVWLGGPSFAGACAAPTFGVVVWTGKTTFNHIPRLGLFPMPSAPGISS